MIKTIFHTFLVLNSQITLKEILTLTLNFKFISKDASTTDQVIADKPHGISVLRRLD